MPRNKDTFRVERLREFVVERRHAINLRQSDVAARSGLSMGWVGMLEAKRLKSQPRHETMKNLALGCARIGEDLDELYQYLQLVGAGVPSREQSSLVANGQLGLDKALRDAVRLAGLPLRQEPDGEVAASLFFDPKLKPERLARVLSLLKVDLVESDWMLAEALLRRLYDTTPAGPLEYRQEPRRRQATNKEA